MLPELPRDIHTSVPDHQVLFSFNDDQDATQFLEWWESEGYRAFEKWAD